MVQCMRFLYAAATVSKSARCWQRWPIFAPSGCARSSTRRVEQVPKEVVSRGDRRVGEVVCSIGNDNQKLIPNLDVDVRIRVQSRPQALLVPREAVRSDQEGRYVFVVKEHRIERRPIVVDIASTTSYAVVK